MTRGETRDDEWCMTISPGQSTFREIQHLADMDEVVRTLDPAIGWAYNAHETRKRIDLMPKRFAKR
jgi:hypothetical protein